MNPAADNHNPPSTAEDPAVWPYMYGLGNAFGEMKGDMNQIKSDLSRIDARLTRVEEKLDDIIRWKNFIAGGMEVILAFGSGLAYVSVRYSITVSDRSPLVSPAPAVHPSPR